MSLQVGVDVTGEAVQRAARKIVAGYKQADDPLSDPLQQWQGLTEGGGKAPGGPVSKQLPSCQLYHGDIATANANRPGNCTVPLLSDRMCRAICSCMVVLTHQ